MTTHEPPRPDPPRREASPPDAAPEAAARVQPQDTTQPPLQPPAHPPLTWLYAPGDRPELVTKALASDADVVIVDLEDAVAPSAKAAARANLAGLLASHRDRAVQVRVNAQGSPWWADDIAAVVELDASVGVRVPKIDTANDARRAIEAAAGRTVHALLETPLAVEHAFSIAGSGVATVGLGEADLRSALGVANADDLGWQRARLINAAAAAGLAPPAMSVYANVRDDEGLARSCRLGRSAGFLGRAAIHPRQLPVIRAAFTPTPDEVSEARAVVDGFRSAADAGSGTFVLSDGRFVDIAMIRAAQRVLSIAAR